MQHKTTQYPDTDRTQNNLSTDTSTQNKHNIRTQHSTENSAHNYRTYSFDFIVEDYISKNSIIQQYTNIIHFGRLINEVTK